MADKFLALLTDPNLVIPLLVALKTAQLPPMVLNEVLRIETVKSTVGTPIGM